MRKLLVSACVCVSVPHCEIRTVAATHQGPTPWRSEPRPTWLPQGWQTTPTPPSSPSGSPSPTAGLGPGTKQLRGLRVNRRKGSGSGGGSGDMEGVKMIQNSDSGEGWRCLFLLLIKKKHTGRIHGVGKWNAYHQREFGADLSCKPLGTKLSQEGRAGFRYWCRFMVTFKAAVWHDSSAVKYTLVSFSWHYIQADSIHSYRGSAQSAVCHEFLFCR